MLLSNALQSEEHTPHSPTAPLTDTTFVSPVEARAHFDTLAVLRPGAPLPHILQEKALRWALGDIVATFNAHMETRGRPDLQLHYKDDFEAADYSYANEYAQAFYSGNRHSRGYVGFRDTVEAVGDAIIHLLDYDAARPHIAFRAPMQSGKTGFMVLLALLVRLFHKRGHTAARVYFHPYNSTGPTEETKRDYSAALHLYANLMVGGFNRTLGSVNSGIVDADQFVKRSTRRSVKQMIDEIVRRAEREGLKEVVFVIDEADHASGAHSVLAQMMKWALRLAESGYPVRVRFVFVSATPYEFSGLDACYPIEIVKHSGQGYRGIVQGDRYHCHAWTKLAEACGIRELTVDFKVAKEGVRLSRPVARMIGRLLKGVDAPHLGLNGMPGNGGRAIVVRYHTSAETWALRKALEEYCKRAKLDVFLHTHNGRRKTVAGKIIKTVDDLLQAVDGPIVIFVTGLARRSDRFDKDCSLFLDFTHKTLSAEAFYQGFVGRASGYKPDNVALFLSEFNMQTVVKTRKFYDETGIDRPQLASTRAILLKEDGTKAQRARTPSRTQHAIELKDLARIDPAFVRALRRRVAASVGAVLQAYPVTRRNGTPGVRVRTLTPTQFGTCPEMTRIVPSAKGVPQFRFDFQALFGGASGWRWVEKCLSGHFRNPVRLLAPGGTLVGSDGVAMGYNNDGGHINVAVGNYDRNLHGDGHQGGGSTTSRWATSAPAQRGKSNTSQKVLMPEFMFRIRQLPDGRYIARLMSIFVYFDRAVRDDSLLARGDGYEWKPRESSGHLVNASDDERRAILVAEIMEKAKDHD